MVFKKKVADDLYCIAIFVEEDLDEDDYVNLVDRLEASGNIVVTTEMELTPESIGPLERKFPNTKLKHQVLPF